MPSPLVEGLAQSIFPHWGGFVVNVVNKAYLQKQDDFFLSWMKNELIVTRIISMDFLHGLVLLLDSGKGCAVCSSNFFSMKPSLRNHLGVLTCTSSCIPSSDALILYALEGRGGTIKFT